MSGHQGEVQLDAWPTGFSDFELETSALLESGDHLMAEWIGRMTHETGQRVELHGVTVATVREGKFATYHDYFDPAELANQLGALATGRRIALRLSTALDSDYCWWNRSCKELPAEPDDTFLTAKLVRSVGLE